MKIDAYRTELPTEALDRVAKPATSAVNRDTKNQATTSVTGGDAVRLSSDARLMQTVMQEAQQTLNIRQDVVDRMRAALANGTVGNDPHALADALLDRLVATSPRQA